MPLNAKEYIKSQVVVKLPIPTKKFSQQTIIVTGSNTGMGLEAARYLVSLDASKVILAVRDTAKGQAAVQSIEASTSRKGVAEVWELDLAKYASVEAFARRVIAELPRLDVVIANAGVFIWEWKMAEDNETDITVNVVSHMLLAMLLLPKMRQTAVESGKPAVFTFTGSFTHFMTEFPERKSDAIFRDLADQTKYRRDDRYYVSKMIQLLIMREFANQLTKSEATKPGKVITSAINPGFVATTIMRHRGKLFQIGMVVLKALLSRTPEEGGRTLVHGAEGREETHGQYLDDCKVAKPSEFVLSEEGDKTQKQLWRELMAKLEKIHPGISGNL
ncbi:hypothetical protein B0H66DRAFT_595770 [Apodospora peruviana]|uniref:NAD(P)-binding protein n=1 Tax=Apodospora peruviana TaxID=516989 RepID=A0AAE0HSL4_9PEZI|nr:hypothetical protein B0H66DRAFT_595770 [Apodospora peruviana]